VASFFDPEFLDILDFEIGILWLQHIAATETIRFLKSISYSSKGSILNGFLASEWQMIDLERVADDAGLDHQKKRQMMRGSIIIFTSFFSILFLKKKLHAYHWAAVRYCILFHYLYVFKYVL